MVTLMGRVDAELHERYLECARLALEAAEYERFLERSRSMS